MKEIPKAFADILKKPSFAHLSTLMADGGPQSSPVWIDTDGSQLVVNSAEGRVKDRNMRRDPRRSVLHRDHGHPHGRFGDRPVELRRHPPPRTTKSCAVSRRRCALTLVYPNRAS